MVDDSKDNDPKERDRRVRKRTRVLRNAKIIVPRRSPVIYCTVENITGGGACLKLASTFGVPRDLRPDFRARPHPPLVPRRLANQR